MCVCVFNTSGYFNVQMINQTESKHFLLQPLYALRTLPVSFVGSSHENSSFLPRNTAITHTYVEKSCVECEYTIWA